MNIRPLTDSYAVSPQIEPEDVAAVKAAGYTTIICNRPDAEVPPDLQADAVEAAARAAGLTFVRNPVVGGALSMDNVTAQGAAIAASDGPVFAYCASGNRSSIVWALSQAGTMPTDGLIAAAQRQGYVQVAGFRDQIEALARARG
jgi:uncharacterized protein (TIGR01244 family)